ncbi:sodium-type flagellar protein MotX [Alishewanella longhuensis]|uniref:Sodium-type flagellar protein MotX n=1 Tax=Alishewanella longhuensis TaxID=1091037 RepID=A0ABQ3KWP5_9ALTE|nr:tetratricopeptide repeat protein [Alishewanella longhuensis]GHG65742.1 sodium-type flagellar protein MotX [Alishewanella longhuensis]
MLRLSTAALLLLFSHASSLYAQELQAVELYTQDELLNLIKANQHLQRVKADDCQLVRDIEARADIMKLPSYQFLFGDMLAYGVCVPRNVERGWDLMLQAAEQGLPEGLEQVGRYYHIGRFVQKDINKAIVYLREASAVGNLNAKIRFAEILLAGQGSPTDFEQSYRWLHHAITADPAIHAKLNALKQQLAKKMPARVVANAQRPVK